MSPFRVSRRETQLHAAVFDVVRLTIEGEGQSFDRDVVIHRGAVAIVAVDAEDRIGVLRQYRAAFDREQWEIPAGTRDVDGESELETAQRELREELGCEARTWTQLGRYAISPGWTDQVMTIFEARDLRPSDRSPDGPEERSSSIHWLTLPELRATLDRLDAVDATMTIALATAFGLSSEHR